MAKAQVPDLTELSDPTYISSRLRVDANVHTGRLGFTITSGNHYSANRKQVEQLREHLEQWLTATEPPPWRVVSPSGVVSYWHLEVRPSDDDLWVRVASVTETGQLLIYMLAPSTSEMVHQSLGSRVIGDAVRALEQAYREAQC